MQDPIYRFGEFELIASESELRTSHSSRRLQEKPLLLLQVLLEHPQRVVTREQLRDRLWGRDTFVDYEQGINVAVKKVRDALGDSAESPKFIETIAKKGYRFLVPVEVSGAEVVLEVLPLPQIAPIPARAEVGSDARRSMLRPGIFVALAIAVLSGIGLYSVRVKTQHTRPTQVHSLAVLPLRNLSSDPGQEYFADGITEELITNLAQSLPLRVISRTSVMRYRQTNEPISQIGRELGVEAIVEGAVARAGDRVVVTVQLIDAPKDRHLWAQQYDRNLEDFLGVEAELSREIASRVGGTLISQTQNRVANARRVNPQVYELYLKGRYFWNKRTEEGVIRAAEYFQQAVKLDPEYAPGYVGLADCYMFGQPPFPMRILALKAKEMLTKALELDDTLGEAHATLGLLAQNSEWDWVAAEREYKRAIELNPNYATAHQWYGEHLALTAKFNESLEEMKLARELDPLSLVILKDTGEMYYVARKYDEAIGYFRKALEIDPGFVLAHRSLGLVYAQKREFSSAIDAFETARQLQDGPEVLSDLGYAYALSGRRREAQEILDNLKVISERRYVFPDAYAAIYAGLGEKDKAFDWLEKAYHEHGLLTGLKVDPRWDSLRSDSRFADLMKRVGFIP